MRIYIIKAVMKEKRYVEGYIATTDIEPGGIVMSPKVIESFVEQLSQNLAKRTVYLEHDVTKPIGEIIDFTIHRKSNWCGLWAKVEIFSDDTWIKIQKGELKGFSICGKVLKYQRKELE